MYFFYAIKLNTEKRELKSIDQQQFQMLGTQFTRRNLLEIIYYLPNMVTAFRIILNFFSIALYKSAPQQSCSLLIMSVILDYVDGIVARNSSQCSFFGDCFDWITDVSSYAIILFWWSNLQPELAVLTFTLLMLEIMTMVVDIIAKCSNYHPRLRPNDWISIILKYTMNCQKRGYNCKGLGFWNEIFHFFCIISRILYLQTHSQLWYYLFIINLPMTISYVWMNLAYSKNILDAWNEEHSENIISLKFIQQ